MTRAALAVLLLVAAASSSLSSCSRHSSYLPDGQFSGSDQAHHRFTVDVANGGVQVNGTKARFTGPGQIEAAKLKGSPALRCQAQARGDEIRCTVQWPDHREVIDLMRL